VLRAIIRRIWNENHQIYGPRKVWRQMDRDELRAARRRVRRLMREMGWRGVLNGQGEADRDGLRFSLTARETALSSYA
jgi:transposase InsO family protein